MGPGVAIALVFVGCCSNVVFLELLVREFPGCGNIVTFAQFLFIALEGFFFEARLGRKKAAIPVSNYFIMVIMFFTVSVINNSALNYSIAMPLHMIFRSGSLIANMILGIIILKKRYSRSKYLSIALVSAGIFLCTFMSAKQVNVSNEGSEEPGLYPFLCWLIGIAMLTFALLVSARMGIFQEVLYKEYGKHPKEALFYNVSCINNVALTITVTSVIPTHHSTACLCPASCCSPKTSTTIPSSSVRALSDKVIHRMKQTSTQGRPLHTPEPQTPASPPPTTAPPLQEPPSVDPTPTVKLLPPPPVKFHSLPPSSTEPQASCQSEAFVPTQPSPSPPVQLEPLTPPAVEPTVLLPTESSTPPATEDLPTPPEAQLSILQSSPPSEALSDPPSPPCELQTPILACSAPSLEPLEPIAALPPLLEPVNVPATVESTYIEAVTPPTIVEPTPVEAVTPPTFVEATPIEAVTPPTPVEPTPIETVTPPTPVEPTPIEAVTPPTPVEPTPIEAVTPPTPVEPTPNEAVTPPTPVEPTPIETVTPPTPVGPTPIETVTPPTHVEPTPIETVTPPTPVEPTPIEAVTPPTPVEPTPIEAVTPPTPVEPTPIETVTPPTPVEVETPSPLTEWAAPPFAVVDVLALESPAVESIPPCEDLPPPPSSHVEQVSFTQPAMEPMLLTSIECSTSPAAEDLTTPPIAQLSIDPAPLPSPAEPLPLSEPSSPPCELETPTLVFDAPSLESHEPITALPPPLEPVVAPPSTFEVTPIEAVTPPTPAEVKAPSSHVELTAPPTAVEDMPAFQSLPVDSTPPPPLLHEPIALPAPTPDLTSEEKPPPCEYVELAVELTEAPKGANQLELPPGAPAVPEGPAVETLSAPVVEHEAAIVVTGSTPAAEEQLLSPEAVEKKLRQEIKEEMQRSLEDTINQRRLELQRQLEEIRLDAHAQAQAAAQALVEDQVKKTLQAEKSVHTQKLTEAITKERLKTEDQKLMVQLYAHQLEEKEKELKKRNNLHKEHVAKLEAKCTEFYRVSAESFQKGKEETHSRFARFNIQPLCGELQSQILKCYQENTGQSLSCSGIASAYMQCVDNAKKNKLSTGG
uniref:Solute carrier family 35 member B4 n=1 Tax=Gouania willdenowi TaxID=441366 RepID=A0A8C5N6J2_GOUWI